MARRLGPELQEYPRIPGSLLAPPEMFPLRNPPMNINAIEDAVDIAFDRCTKTKTGNKRNVPSTPSQLVDSCLNHLRTRSDPILSPYFVSLLDPQSLFDFDAVSYEMQRHRMTIGVFYQYLLLELMRVHWQVFDGYKEGDIVADIDTPTFSKGLRLYMSVKKSSDTVGGQDFGGVVRRIETIAKEEKNLTRPYMCVFCIATPYAGRVAPFEEDRRIKSNRDGKPYSMNCEVWGPGFIYPYLTGRSAKEIYVLGIQRVAAHLPFLSIEFRQECATLLAEKLNELELLDGQGHIAPARFLDFVCR